MNGVPAVIVVRHLVAGPATGARPAPPPTSVAARRHGLVAGLRTVAAVTARALRGTLVRLDPRAV